MTQSRDIAFANACASYVSATRPVDVSSSRDARVTIVRPLLTSATAEPITASLPLTDVVDGAVDVEPPGMDGLIDTVDGLWLEYSEGLPKKGGQGSRRSIRWLEEHYKSDKADLHACRYATWKASQNGKAFFHRRFPVIAEIMKRCANRPSCAPGDIASEMEEERKQARISLNKYCINLKQKTRVQVHTSDA